MTVGEVLVRPRKQRRQDVVEIYLALFSSSRIRVMDFNLQAATSYAGIRQDRTIRLPDAIQLACAAAGGTDLFITSDERLSRQVVPGVKFITSLGRAPI